MMCRRLGNPVENSTNLAVGHSCRRLVEDHGSTLAGPWAAGRDFGQSAGEWMAAHKKHEPGELAMIDGGHAGSWGAAGGVGVGRKEWGGEIGLVRQVGRHVDERGGVSSWKGQGRWRCSCGEVQQTTVQQYRGRRCRQACLHACVCCLTMLHRQSEVAYGESFQQSHCDAVVSSAVWCCV